jgi:hypothetical protein
MVNAELYRQVGQKVWKQEFGIYRFQGSGLAKVQFYMGYAIVVFN